MTPRPGILRRESTGGMLLVAAAVLALVWANSPWADGYTALRDLEVGYAPWGLRLSLGSWASDGLLALFFFVVGLELMREIVAGDLRRFGTAVVPVAAAAGGVAVPALIYTAIVWSDPSLRVGWAIPTATDIAFAVSVLALIGSRLPGALRIFLLTLAVVDDLIAIGIIAVFYTARIEVVPLLAGVAAIAAFGVVVRRGEGLFRRRPAAAVLLLLPLALAAWGFVHASGVHATIAGVALAFTVPVRPRAASAAADGHGLSAAFEHRLRPLSTGFAVPVFAFFSAGVAVGGLGGLGAALADPVALGVIAGLVIGKPLGIVLTTRLVTRVRGVRLHPAVRGADLVGVAMLAGVGFTVSLLIGELSFAAGTPQADHAKIAVLIASLTASALATLVLLRWRLRTLFRANTVRK